MGCAYPILRTQSANYQKLTTTALRDMRYLFAGIERVIDTFQVPILIWYTVSISLTKVNYATGEPVEEVHLVATLEQLTFVERQLAALGL